MRQLLIAFALAAFTLSAHAADSSCEAQAAAKKLHGAAKNSFVKKCSGGSADGKMASCEAKAKEKKLHGAAKNSFVKKCAS